MGVRRAVEMVLEMPGKQRGPIFTFGPLIHNPQVLELLREKGISVLEDIPDHGSGTVLIRAHGIPPAEKQGLEAAGFRVVDATCPRVTRVQSIIARHADQGYESVIVGDRDHPEVRGLLGFAKGRGAVVDKLEDLEALPSFNRAIVVAQTTQSMGFFAEIESWVGSRFPHYRIFNTICDSTAKRQAEVSRLAESVDAVIVVGGKSSGNTQRLAQIAGRAGVPAYHIESEAELDAEALASVRSVGITAGASTPNWVTRRVQTRLEAMLARSVKGWQGLAVSVQRGLLLTNIYVSLGAGCLEYACTRLQDLSHHSSHALIAILYVQSMHILNHLTGSEADRFNDPDRADFYRRYMVLLTLLAVIAGGAGLLAAYGLGPVSFLVLFAMSIMGLSYNLRLLPDRFSFLRYRRIRDIPGSKTILIALAWGVVTAILPPLSSAGSLGLGSVLVFLISTCMVFVRTAFFDILDMQGDRIVGKETIPILLGEKRTVLLLKILLAAVFLVLIATSARRLVSGLGFALAVCPVLMAVFLSAHERGYVPPLVRLEFLVDTNFLLTGMVALLWHLL